METGEGEKAHGSVHSTEKELLLQRSINAILCYGFLSPAYKGVKAFAATRLAPAPSSRGAKEADTLPPRGTYI